MEAIALQTQINPHFLYNTLHVISAYSTTLTDYDNEITQMLENLSKMLKYTFSTKSFTTTVSEELSYLKIYCNFQKERFFEKFDIFFEIEDSLLSEKVLKLMFQPVFENAITHGIRCCDKKCHIILKGYMKNGYMIFDIINNGIPIDKNNAKRINKYLSGGEIREDEHIGLSNINKRIKIIFGTEYGVSILRNENEKNVTRIKLLL